MVKRNKCYRPQLVIPQTFEQCFTYEKQVLFLKNEIDKLKTQGDTSKIEQRLSAVEASVTNLNNEVAEINVDDIKAQLQTINAELTELKNKSSAQADSITALQTTVADNKTATDKALARKYDSSNIESGKGELSPAHAVYEGCEGRFDYVKNGKVVTVSINITKLIADKAYIQMSGLPFPAKIESKLSCFVVYSTTNKLRNIRLDGSWLYISSPGDKFAEGEKINLTITYIRQ